jgi:hypothetical protein
MIHFQAMSRAFSYFATSPAFNRISSDNSRTGATIIPPYSSPLITSPVFA